MIPKRAQAIPPGPYSSSTVAAVAGIPPSTVRAWAERHVNARHMWPKLYGDEQGERRRRAAMKFKKELEAAGEESNWIDETLKQMEQPSGPLKFADVELLQICALAELTQHGFTPARTTGEDVKVGYLLGVLTRELAVRAFLVPDVGDKHPLGPEEHEGVATRYLVAERRNENPALSLQTLTPSELGAYFSDPSRTASTMWTVVDCDALLRRIVARLESVESGAASSPEEPTP